MMEKQNRVCEKRAAGDAGDIDDLVEGAAKRLARTSVPQRKPRIEDELKRETVA